MSDFILQVDRILQRDRSFYLRLCAWCNRAGWRCDHSHELARQAKGRFRSLRRAMRVGVRPWAGPWFPLVQNVGLLPPPRRLPAHPVLGRVALAEQVA